jgi:DNA-binding response OmpR family regulator
VASPRIKVLLVEDEPADANLIRVILSEAGDPAFDVESVERLKEGLERLARERVDIVLLDLFLPNSDGLETFMALSAQAPEVPIVVLTVFDDETAALEAVRKDAQDYLAKDHLDSRMLSRVIRYAIERHRMQTPLPYALSLSVGTASYDPQRALSVEELMAQADQALYEQKRAKRHGP